MARQLIGRWGNRNTRDFLYQISLDFAAQLQGLMGRIVNRAELAKKLAVSKGRVSQVLNNPGNLTMLKVVQYTRALGYKVAIVVYDDGDPANEYGPIVPQIFEKCWQVAGRPRDFIALRQYQTVVNLPHADLKPGNVLRISISTGGAHGMVWSSNAIETPADIKMPSLSGVSAFMFCSPEVEH